MIGSEGKRLSEWAKINAAWLASVAVLVGAVVRLLAVSEMDNETALALLQVSSVAHLGLATLMWLWPTLLIVTATLSLSIGIADGRVTRTAWICYGAIVLTASAAVNIISFAIILFIPVMYWVLLRTESRSKRGGHGSSRRTDDIERLRKTVDTFEVQVEELHRLTSRPAESSEDVARVQNALATLETLHQEIQERLNQDKRRIALIVSMSVVFAIVIALVIPTMWLPPERIQLAERQLIGYVVDDGDWYTVLESRPRRVVKIAQADILERTICRPGISVPSFLSLIFGDDAESRYANCVLPRRNASPTQQVDGPEAARATSRVAARRYQKAHERSNSTEN